jgi:hypothetical protein
MVTVLVMDHLKVMHNQFEMQVSGHTLHTHEEMCSAPGLPLSWLVEHHDAHQVVRDHAPQRYTSFMAKCWKPSTQVKVHT